MNIEERFDLHTVRPEEAEEAAAVETACFPESEACPRERMLERIAAAPDFFLVAVDREKGRVAGMLNGLATDEEVFRDEFFRDAGLHDPQGKNVLLLGLAVLPDYRRMGLATALMERYLRTERERGRESVILTCLVSRVKMYQNMGFADFGISASRWGGEQWHEMVCRLVPSEDAQQSESITRQGNPAKPRGEAGEQMLTRMNQSHAGLTAWALGFWTITAEDQILDIGCGGGAALRRMAETMAEAEKRTPECAEAQACEEEEAAGSRRGHLTGVDYSRVSVELAKKTNVAFIAEERMDIREASVEALPFPDASFDKILTVESFYFWPDPQENLREVVRVLRPGGTFLLVADIYQNGELPQETQEMAREYRLLNPTKEEFEELLREAGFSQVLIHTEEGEPRICVEGHKAR